MILKDFAKNFIKEDEGSGMVEFVLVLPIMIYVTLIFVSLFQYIYATTTAEHAAAAAIRAAVIQDSESKARNIARETAMDSVDGAGANIKWYNGQLVSSGSWSRGNIATYYVTLDVGTVIRLPSRGKNLRTTRAVAMMIERSD